METKSGRSSRVSNRSTSSSRLSRPGSAVDLLLERMGAIQENIGAAQADTRNSIEAIKADNRESMAVIHADIGAVGVAQLETREVLENVIHRLERLEASPVPKFVAGLDLNPSLSTEITVAPHHSTISLEVKQGNPEVSTTLVVLRRSERLANKLKVEYRQVALQPRWPISTAASSNPCPVPTLYPSSSVAALQQHTNPSAFETVSATLVVIVIVIVISKLLKRYLKAKRTRAPAYSRALRRIKGGFPKGGQEKLRSEFQSTRRGQSSC